jgi:hypothetical protein
MTATYYFLLFPDVLLLNESLIFYSNTSVVSGFEIISIVIIIIIIIIVNLCQVSRLQEEQRRKEGEKNLERAICFFICLEKYIHPVSIIILVRSVSSRLLKTSFTIYVIQVSVCRLLLPFTGKSDACLPFSKQIGTMARYREMPAGLVSPPCALSNSLIFW